METTIRLICAGCKTPFDKNLSMYNYKVSRGVTKFFHSRKCATDFAKNNNAHLGVFFYCGFCGEVGFKTREQYSALLTKNKRNNNLNAPMLHYECVVPYVAKLKMARLEERFWSFVDKSPNQGPNGDCWEWQGKRDQDGYGRFSVQNKAFKPHRFSYKLANGKLPEDLLVCHSCDNPPCVNPKHLFLGSNRDNMQDMVNKGRSLKGEANRVSKLNGGKVKFIRNLYKNGYNCAQISRMFKMDSSTIGDIVNRKYWKHIE